MAAPTKARQAAEVDPYLAAAKHAIDNAPSLGKRGTYMKTPPGVSFFAPAQGRTYRLLFLGFIGGKRSPKPGTLNLVLPLTTHGGVGPQTQTFLCAQQMFGQKCAVCDEYMRLKRPRMEPEEYSAISGMKPKFREARLVHDLDGDRDNLQIWEESTFLFGDHFIALIGNRPSYQYYAHPTRGMIIEVQGKKKAVGKGECTDYATIVMTPFSKEAGCEQIPTKLIEKAKKIKLDDYLIEPPEYKKLMLLARGAVADVESNGQPYADAEEDPVEEGETVVEETAETEEEVVEEEVPAETEEEVVEETEEEVIEEDAPIEDEIVEEEEAAEPQIEVGSTVSFKNKEKKIVKGEVIAIDGDKAKVKSGKSVYTLGLDKLTLA